MTPHLTSHHRRTVEKIVAHPTSGNIEWRQVGSLLAAIGRVESEGNRRLHISVGAEPEVVLAAHGKDASVQTVVDLRALLTRVGPAPRARAGR
jgi:predicted DNA-binding protein with PD1-like motif